MAAIACKSFTAAPLRASARSTRCERANASALQCMARSNGHTEGPSPRSSDAAARKVAAALAAAVLSLSTVPAPAVAGEIETLEGEELPTLVEKLGDIVNPEEESAAAAALSEVESEVTKLDETEQAQGEGFVQEQANAIKETIESLKETFNLK